MKFFLEMLQDIYEIEIKIEQDIASLTNEWKNIELKKVN